MTANATALALHPRTLGQWLARDGGEGLHRPEVALVPVEVVESPTVSAGALALVSPPALAAASRS